MSNTSAPTTFVSRGRLKGVLRQRSGRSVRSVNAGQAPSATADLDTKEYEALYYRARLILGEDLPRPARLQSRGR